MEVELQEKVHKWAMAEKALAKCKKLEKVLREEVLKEAFPASKIGTNKVDMNKGYVLKGVFKETTKVDKAALLAIKDKFPEGTLDMTIKYEPSLISSGYKHMPLKLKKILDEVLIVKPGSSSLEIVPPKDK